MVTVRKDGHRGGLKGFCVDRREHPDFGTVKRPIYFSPQYLASLETQIDKDILVNIELALDEETWIATPDGRDPKAMVAELDRLSTELGNRREELAALDNQIATKQAELAEMEKVDRKIAQRYQQLRSLDERIASLEINKEGLEKTNKNLRENNQELGRNAEKLRKQITRLESQVPPGERTDDSAAAWSNHSHFRPKERKVKPAPNAT